MDQLGKGPKMAEYKNAQEWPNIWMAKPQRDGYVSARSHGNHPLQDLDFWSSLSLKATLYYYFKGFAPVSGVLNLLEPLVCDTV